MEFWVTNWIFVVAALNLVVSVFAVPTDMPDYNQNEKIRKKVLENYDTMALPHRDQNGTTNVYFQLVLNGFWIEEDKQILNVNAWVMLEWQDPRLTWDYKNFGGVKSLHLAAEELWKPDITLYNNADSSTVNHFGNVHAVVTSAGNVVWAPPGTFRSECPLDLTLWPYDQQTCYLTFGSWTTHGWLVSLDLKNNQTRPYLGWFLKYSHQWQYVTGSLARRVTEYQCCPEPYHSISTTIVLRRDSPSFASIIIVPAVVISLLTLLQFLLPLREPKRLTIGFTSALLTLLTLFFVSYSVPTLAFSVPIIVKFYGQTLAVVLVSLVVTVLLMRLTDAQHPAASTPPPALLKTILTGPVGSIMFLQKYMDKVGHSGGGDADAEVLEDVRPVNYAHEWLLVAAAVDRLASVAFLATFIITLIAYSAVL